MGAMQSQTVDFTIRIPKIDMKRFKGLAKAMGWTYEKNEDSYFESQQFYKDLDKAEQDIADGKGVTVSSIEELNSLFV